MKDISGVYPAIITSYSKNDYNVDLDAFKNFLKWLIKAGVDGAVVIGSTGEAPYLEREERLEIIKAAKETVGTKKVIVGVGSVSLKRALRYAVDAERVEVDAFLIVTPFFFRYSQDEIITYYKTISKSVDTPILLYNIPQATGSWIAPETVDKLVDGEKIIGIKDSSGDIGYHIKVLSKIRDRGVVFCGNARISPAALMMGTKGLILALVNLLPKSFKDIYKEIKAGNYERAIRIYWRIYPLINESEKFGIPLLKYLLNKVGFKIGPPRPPLKELEKIENENVLIDILEHEIHSV